MLGAAFVFFLKDEMPLRLQKHKNLLPHAWKSRAFLTPEGKAMLTPENFFILTPLKS
jgi:hypothetical protein